MEPNYTNTHWTKLNPDTSSHNSINLNGVLLVCANAELALYFEVFVHCLSQFFFFFKQSIVSLQLTPPFGPDSESAYAGA